MFIPIILGTAREGRESEKVAKFMLNEVRKAGHETELIDVRDYRIPATDNSESSATAKNYIAKIEKADALIIVSPEYNHGYPGELKMMLDMAYKQYWGKPVGFCGVSISLNGGLRVVEQLRLVFIEFRMTPIREAMYFRKVKELFETDERIKDANYSKFAETFLKDLVNHVKK